ncbi:MAG: hypothetical protein ACR2IE_11860 [Candidatus Sumerlaeaceae bacterium]
MARELTLLFVLCTIVVLSGCQKEEPSNSEKSPPRGAPAAPAVSTPAAPTATPQPPEQNTPPPPEPATPTPVPTDTPDALTTAPTVSSPVFTPASVVQAPAATPDAPTSAPARTIVDPAPPALISQAAAISAKYRGSDLGSFSAAHASELEQALQTLKTEHLTAPTTSDQQQAITTAVEQALAHLELARSQPQSRQQHVSNAFSAVKQLGQSAAGKGVPR